MSEQIRFYNQADPCPACATPLSFDGGRAATFYEPEQLPALFCSQCGLEYDIDWERFGNENTHEIPWQTRRPDWWPRNPYPVRIFTLTEEELCALIPDEMLRTRISGLLMREAWDLASSACLHAFEHWRYARKFEEQGQ